MVELSPSSAATAAAATTSTTTTAEIRTKTSMRYQSNSNNGRGKQGNAIRNESELGGEGGGVIAGDSINVDRVPPPALPPTLP